MGTEPVEGQAPRENSFDQALRIDCPPRVAGGFLAIGRSREDIGGLPVEAFQGLFLIRDGRALRIRSSTDLEGRVSIRSPSEALSYLRLFSSPRDYWMMARPTYAEVCRRKALSLSLLLGDSKLLSFLRRLAAPALCVIPDEAWPFLDTSVEVGRAEGGFRITRLLVRDDGQQAFAARVSQLVTPRGTVRIERETRVKGLSVRDLGRITQFPYK